MSSCPTRSVDGPWYSDIECSGQGVCEVFLNRSLCRCSVGYSGGSDFFDLRVEQDPLTGEWLSLDCPNSALGTQIIWGITLAVYFFIWIRGLLAFSHYFGFKTILQNCVAIELFVNLPILQAIAVFKLLYPGTVVFGTSIWETVLFIMTESFHSIIHFKIGILEFKMFGLQQSKRFNKILNLYSRFIWINFLIFLLTAIVSPLIMLGLSKTIGPILNFQFILLLIRNIMTIYLVAVGYLGQDQNLKKFKQAFATKASGSNENEGDLNNSSSTLENRAKKTISFLTIQRTNAMYGTILLGCIYLIASLPWIWPYQTYFIATMACIGNLGFNASLILEHRNNIKDRNNSKPGAIMAPADNTATDKQEDSKDSTSPTPFMSDMR